METKSDNRVRVFYRNAFKYTLWINNREKTQMMMSISPQHLRREQASLGMGVPNFTLMSRDPSQQIIDVSVALIILSVIGVSAIGYLINANLTGWSASQTALFQIVITFSILGFALLILYATIGKSRGKR